MILQSDTKKLLESEENYPKVKHETLIDKYRIPVQHFEYSYIETCKDGRELEKIVQILRSGEEGYFPDLTRCAENRLAVIKPKSKLLRKPCPVIQKETLNNEEKSEIAQDLTRWISNISKDDDELVFFKNRKSGARPFPDVRQTKEKVLEEKKTISQKRISSTDYSSWDKYDPDTEILKMDLEEENLKKAALKKEKKKSTPKKIVHFKDFTTDVEALREANYEKEKGNEFFRTGDYSEALKHYTNSINCKPTVAGFNNRALTNIKLKNFKNAVDDCNSALSIESNNVKAFLRKAQALESLAKHTEALESVQRAIEVDPNNSLAQELAEKFRKLCGNVPPKVKRFLVQDIEKEETNQKKILSKHVAFTKNNEVIIPIPGTSNMSPPHYITCTNGDPRKIKEQTMRVHTAGQVIRLVSIDNSEIDDDDCCTVNHLKKICSNENLSNSKESSETKTLLQHSLKDEKRENFNKSGNTSKNIKSRKGKKGKVVIAQSSEHETENKPKQVPQDPSSYVSLRSEVNNLLYTEDSYTTPDMKTIEQRSMSIEEKIPSQQSVKEDTNAGGEPYIKNERFDIPQDIHSPYNFIKAWNSANFDKTLEQHAAILRSVDMNRIVEVIGCKLDNTMFAVIIKCLCTHFAVPGEVERLYVILTNIVNLPRFVIIAMLMSAEDQNCVNTLVNFLKQHGRSLCQETLNKFFNN